MSLLDIRRQFIEDSGRHDLVVDLVAYVDQGANRFIRAGQRFLDGRLSSGAVRSVKETFTLVAGEGSIADPFFASVKAVTKALLYDSDGYVRTLSKKESATDQQFITAEMQIESVPQYFVFGIRDETLYLAPSASRDLTLHIETVQYSDALTDNTDENWWTRNYPDVLTKAALYWLEVTYRNREGAADWLSSLEQDIFNIEASFVEQEMADVYVQSDIF